MPVTRRPADQEKWGRRLRRDTDAERSPKLATMTLPPFEVWRSRDFFVQVFNEGGVVRLTVNRTYAPNGIDWADGITWDELQRIKAEVGRNDRWAVEVYPPDEHVVNDANMRHLWLLDTAPTFGWTDG